MLNTSCHLCPTARSSSTKMTNTQTSGSTDLGERRLWTLTSCITPMQSFHILKPQFLPLRMKIMTPLALQGFAKALVKGGQQRAGLNFRYYHTKQTPYQIIFDYKFMFFVFQHTGVGGNMLPERNLKTICVCTRSPATLCKIRTKLREAMEHGLAPSCLLQSQKMQPQAQEGEKSHFLFFLSDNS